MDINYDILGFDRFDREFPPEEYLIRGGFASRTAAEQYLEQYRRLHPEHEQSQTYQIVSVEAK